MKKSFLTVTFVVPLLIAMLLPSQLGCTKDCTVPPVTYSIQGLWEGTFTTLSGFVEPPGTNFYFSLSLYSNGSLIYKSGTSNNSLFVYGTGTWSLTGTNFAFTARTLNGTSSQGQDNVSGSGSFDKDSGKLANGTVSSTTANTTASWRMEKVK
jgi:hypothetical protein